MHRRVLSRPFLRRFVPVALILMLGACTTVGALLGNDLQFSQMQLQQQLDRRFPRDYEKLGGLVSLSLLHPRLTIPAQASRLQLDFDLGIGTMGRTSHEPAGHVVLTSGLRYDPATRGLHLSDPAIESLDAQALGGAMNPAIRSALNRWLVDYARDEPVYRFDDSLLGRLGARRVTATRITGGQVVVQLGH